MKPITALIVFFSLMLPSLILSYGNYTTTKVYIIEDVNQALAQTILLKKYDRITADTLKVYRSNLKIERLRETSYLSMCTAEPSKMSFCSDTMSYKCGTERLYVRAYPNCSKAAVFCMSEQTVPGVMFLTAILWGLSSVVSFHKKNRKELAAGCDRQTMTLGNLSFSERQSLFFDDSGDSIYFTPMQLAFMKILMTSESKRVPVDEICHQLWPGKDNARESLYTLVRRVKPVVESSSNVRIVAEKGGYYALVVGKG